MFRASETEPQMSLFDNPSDMMCKRAAKKYEDPKAWQNQFYRMVTSEIDESLFQPLFKEGRMGAPNASIRRLVAMSVLKEGFGCYSFTAPIVMPVFRNLWKNGKSIITGSITTTTIAILIVTAGGE